MTQPFPAETAPAPVLVWFGDDLRLDDNPALAAAAATGAPVAALYVLDDETGRATGGAARWWLHHALAGLAAGLSAFRVPLVLRRGPVEAVVPAVAEACGAGEVVWNLRADPALAAAEARVAAVLAGQGRTVRRFLGDRLFAPGAIVNGSGAPYRVFTPFWRAAMAGPAPKLPKPAPGAMNGLSDPPPGVPLGELGLLPARPDWAGGLRAAWMQQGRGPDEAMALARLDSFIENDLAGYAGARDDIGREATSLLSPALRFGQISPRRIFHSVGVRSEGREAGAAKFLAEVGWREFCRGLLGQFPDLATVPIESRFAGLEWRDDPSGLRAWQKGETGIPLVDAAQRALWQTGFVHNRARMVAASFLVKHLLIDWRQGEQWYWDTLVDADIASNPASWQWVAGCGADAAPFIRVFNPVLQGEKFDAAGRYVRRFVPELARLPDKWLHRPWMAPPGVLAAAGVRIGRDYPAPVVDPDTGRRRALAAFEAMRAQAPRAQPPRVQGD